MILLIVEIFNTFIYIIYAKIFGTSSGNRTLVLGFGHPYFATKLRTLDCDVGVGDWV